VLYTPSYTLQNRTRKIHVQNKTLNYTKHKQIDILSHSTQTSHSACSESVGGPSGAAPGEAVAALPVRLPRGWPEASPPLTTVRRRPIRSLHDVAATKRRATVTSHALWRVARHFGQFPASVATSGELILLPVWGRHPKVNAGQRPLARYSDCDILQSFSRTLPAYRTLRVQNGG